MHALALAALGNLQQAISLRNRTSDLVRAAGAAGSANYAGDRALLAEIVRCVQRAEAAYALLAGPLQIEPVFRYIVCYPRTGSTLLIQFLCHAFDAPNYSVYAGGGRYFSRRFHERAPGHAVFVKDHVLRPEYLDDGIVSTVRDGRDATVSLARYLYAEGSHQFVRRGELADFISFVAARMPYGSWGAHACGLLDARERGARIHLVPYENVVGGYSQLLSLAHELAGGAAEPRDDEAGFAAFSAGEKRRMSVLPEWSEGIPLPEDSFIPQNWSVGGGTIDWRRAFDAPARRRFHELGGTEALLRLGYETDEGWWRNA